MNNGNGEVGGASLVGEVGRDGRIRCCRIFYNRSVSNFSKRTVFADNTPVQLVF